MKGVPYSKRLDEVCLFTNGLWTGKKPPFARVCVYRNTNFASDGSLDHSDVAELEVEERHFEKRRLVPGDIILEKSGGGPKQPVGRVALFERSDGDFSFSNFTSSIRVRESTLLDYRFLKWFLQWTYVSGRTVDMQTHATGIRNLDLSAYKAITVPVPALDEQRRLAVILDSAFEGIAEVDANDRKCLANARAVFDSAREEALAPRDGWRTGPLGELCSIKHGYAFKGEFFSDAGEFVLLTPGSFHERGGYRERGEKTKYYIGEIPAGFVLNEGDMLTAMTEQAAGLLGSPLLVPESGKFLHNQRLGLFVPTPGRPWVAKFFFHTMNLARVRKEIHDGGTGAKVRHTSPGRIQAVRVSYPASEKEQQVVADHLDEIAFESERLENIYEQKLAALDELKKSLLHHAFTGAV